jgi:phosphoribosyl 1,2-cyclic phosphodiesterase
LSGFHSLTGISFKHFDQKIKSAIVSFVESGNSISQLDEFIESIDRHDKGGYGGNTSCVEVRSKEGQQIIIDGGSGLRPLGASMMQKESFKDASDVHIFMTHFHWDHLMGIPFFIPLFVPGKRVHFYGVQDTIHTFLDVLFQKPYFPVEKKDLAAELITHQIQGREPFHLGDLVITPYLLDHPDPCWGYRVECGEKSYAHCVDTECTRMSRKDLGPDLPLYTGADVMTFDAQYSLEEVTARINWGHSAAAIGLDIAEREQIKHLIFVHHDPYAPDATIAEQISMCQKHQNSLEKQAERRGEVLYDVRWEYGYDGMKIEV